MIYYYIAILMYNKSVLDNIRTQKQILIGYINYRLFTNKKIYVYQSYLSFSNQRAKLVCALSFTRFAIYFQSIIRKIIVLEYFNNIIFIKNLLFYIKNIMCN